MKEPSPPFTNLPPEQEAIRAKCFHPSGTFVEFSKEEFEQSIPERFEKIACRYSKQLAIKVGNTFLTYGELNEEANRIAHPILNSVGEGFDGHGAPIVTAILGALQTDETIKGYFLAFCIEPICGSRFAPWFCFGANSLRPECRRIRC